MHSAVTLVTYTDFGQNCGRYIAGDGGNALLQYIRQQEGGIAITYTNGNADYVISNAQGMIDFSAGYNRSLATAISPTIVVTVGHNGEQSSSFTSDVYGIGGSHCINYKSVSIGGSSVFSNAYNDGRYVDYRISRQSKIFTDITPVEACSSTQEARDLVSGTNMFYHSGAGYHQYPGLNLPYQAYVYETGGIIDPLSLNDTSAGGLRVGTTFNGVNATNPLPYAALAGDSGSPVYVYDAEEGVYKFWGCTALSDGTNCTYLSYTNKYQEALNAFNKSVDMSSVSAVDGKNTVYLNAVDEVTGTQSDGSNSTTLYAGKIKDAEGNVLTTHIGLKSGLSTWGDLSGVKNNQNWYNYGNGYVAQNNADLYFTENLLFSSSAAQNAVVLNATVDLGVGYAEFSAAGDAPVSYTVSSASGGNFMLNSAGYLVNENVSLHLQITSSDTHMYEWRKIGAGDMYIEGSGDNNILLNLGGSGTTYLKRTGGGYAAYNVLVNNGARVVIDDIGQIERDFTFGNKGGVLDMNGQSMDWYTTSTSETIADAGFTINALTEDAVIANNKGNSTLVYRQGGETSFLGSFRDSADSSLKIQYAGGGTWVLNSVHTHLQNDNSGLQVDNGKVVLRGTNTIHAEGSANGSNANRYTNANDWHYADAAMDVTVKDGATFELGSHARLTGDVTVESGGTYVMREGVKLSQEYVEGGQRLEDTSKYADYYGHKGNTVLDGGTLQVEYSAGVTAHNTYAGNISGSGNMSVDLKDSEAVFTLSGDNTFTGTKTLVSGGLIADSATALGDTSANKWVIQEEGWIASHKETGAQLLEHIDTSSTGTLVLSADSEQLDIAGYNGLFVGAEAGKTVQYGTLGTIQTLNAEDGAWRLGGGGGTLVVNYVLSGDYDLLLGATENSTGVVHLTNQGNSFTGNIVFSGEGVLLTYEDGALGSAIVDLSYGNASDLFSSSDVLRMSSGSDGMVLVDNLSDNAIDLRNHSQLTVGVAADKTWSGEFWLAENQAYRFGTLEGATLTVTSPLAAGHDLIVDAQGSSGGKVVLDATGITGQVSVMGRKDGTGGDITLVIAQDDALSAASGVSVQNGGILELGDSSHVLHNVEVQSGGQIKTTSSSDLIFNITEDSTVAGRVQLGTVEKTGAANLALSGDAGSSWSLLTIREGSVTVGSGSLGSNIALAGGVLAADSGAVVNYNGVISIAEGATESIRGGSWKFTGAENIVNKGTLNLQNTKLYFNSTSAQTLRGTLNVVGSSELHSIESNGADFMQKQLEHIHVASGNELKIVDHTWNTIWHIDKLTGDGTFKWNPQNTHYYSSSVVIDGDGGFSGTLDFYRQHDPGYADTADTYSKNFQAYLQIDSEEAISGATVNLVGTWALYANRDAYATLALNDERIKIGGLKATDSPVFAHVMAGAAPSGVSRSAPDSTRSTTLEITGSGNYEYKGTIGTQGDKTSSYGVSIEMTGTGTQLFNGSTVVVNDVAALNGTLNFNSSGLYIKGDVTVAQGATLKLNDSFTLSSGHTLNVVAGANGGAAVLNSGLVFDGGTLHFDVLSSSSAVLAVNGSISASDAGGMNLTFADTDALPLGVKYLLASGDWSGMEDRISLFTPELYKQMTLETGNSGLSIQLDMKEGFAYWGGNYSEVQPGNKLVFMGGEGNLSRLEITGGAQADTAVFDNEGDFTISSTDGSALAIGTMGKYDTGALVVNTNVTADTLLVEDTSALKGTGKLAVGEISGSGTLQVAGGAHLQVEAGEGTTLQLLDGAKLTTTGTALGTDLVLGEDEAASRVNLDIQGAELSLNGAFVAKENTTLVVQGTGALNTHTGMNELAEIQLSSTSTLNVGTTLSTKVAQNGATVNVNNGGVWQLTADNHQLSGTVNVNTGGMLSGKDVALSSGFVELSGQMEYDSFTVQNGATLNLRAGGRLDSTNAATIAKDGIMRLNLQTLQDKVELKDGGTLFGNGGTIGGGAEVIATSGTGTLSAGDGTLTVNGHIGAAAGATLRLEGNRVDIYAANINTGGGVLELSGNTYLGYRTAYATQNIGGTLSVVTNSTLHTEQGDPSRYQNITHNINHLHISDGKKLTITDSTGDWNHIYNIASLTGCGDIEWKGVNRWFDNTPSGPSRLVLSSANLFEGTLLVNQEDNHGSMQHVSLAHDYAAEKMVINMWGDSNSRPGLTISTRNAHVAGIGGTENTFVYAGDIKSYGNGSNPVSSALNTLTINTAGKDHTYNGTILGDAANGLNIVKDGAGSQTFTNSANVVHDVTALQGSLEFTAVPTIHGDISIAQGAELALGSGDYSLDAGHSLNVLAGADGMPAVLNNSLVLNGGSLKFGVYSTSTASLSIQGVSLGSDFSTLNVSFGNTTSITAGTSYLLAGGDWSALDGKLTYDAGDYLTATLSASDRGLMASFSMADGYSVWSGDESVLQPEAKVLFGTVGGSNEVILSASASIDAAYFDNLRDVTVSSANGATLTASHIEKHGAGALVVNNTVNADTLRVAEISQLAGSGLVSVDSMEISKGAQATVNNLTLAVQSEITGDGSLRMGLGSTLQVQNATTGNVQLMDGSTLTTAGNEVKTNLTLGDSGGDSRVTMSFGGSGLALTGNVAVQGNTTLAVQGIGALSFNSAFNNLSTLELKKGVSLNLNSALTTGLHLNGGTAVASGTSSGNKILQGNITITNGGSLTFAGDESVCDTLNHQAMGKSVTVSGGTLDFGTTRQTMGSWELRLSDGAQVLGSGGKYGEKYAAMDFNTNNSTIYATSGSSTISAKTRLRDGNNLNYDVSKDATLTVNGLIHADDAAGKGSITKVGDGTLVLTSANTYANTTTVNAGVLRTSTNGALGTSAVVINGGVLELAPAGGEEVNASILKGAVTVNDGGTLRLGGSDNKVVDTNVTINAGGRMEFTGAGSDMIDYTNGKSKTITVNGGVIDVGTTRQTMQNTALVLKNGAKIEGAGGSYGASYTAGLDYNTASSIVVESGENTIDSNIRIRNVKLTFDVRDDAELALNGRMHYDTNDGKSIVVEKQGGGRMEVNSLVKLATLNPKGGELVLAHTGAQNVLGMLDGSQGGTSKGTLSLAQNVDLKVTGKIYGCSTSAIKMESGARLTSTEDGVIIGHGGGTGSASMVCNAADGEYSVSNADFEFNNVHLKYDSSNARTLSNKLTNSTIENMNSGGKLLTVDNQHNTLAGVVASRGDINVLNQEALSLNVLEVATGKSVGMYTGENTSSAKAAVAVSSSAVFGAGAALTTASLTLADGATLEMTSTVDAVNLNGAALTFGSGVHLGENLLSDVLALGCGESLALFTGVGEFSLPIVAAVTEMESERVLASSVFSNVESSNLYVGFSVIDNVGTLMVVNVPEPATTTLSLLALTSLAMRRRRR